jgi:hypothetical protein
MLGSDVCFGGECVTKIFAAPQSAIIEPEPVGHGVLLVVVARLPAFLAVEAGARPDHPIVGS